MHPSIPQVCSHVTNCPEPGRARKSDIYWKGQIPMCHQHGLATESLLDPDKMYSLLTEATDLENWEDLARTASCWKQWEDDSREKPCCVRSDNQQCWFSRTAAQKHSRRICRHPSHLHHPRDIRPSVKGVKCASSTGGRYFKRCALGQCQTAKPSHWQEPRDVRGHQHHESGELWLAPRTLEKLKSRSESETSQLHHPGQLLGFGSPWSATLK